MNRPGCEYMIWRGFDHYRCGKLIKAVIRGAKTFRIDRTKDVASVCGVHRNVLIRCGGTEVPPCR